MDHAAAISQLQDAFIAADKSIAALEKAFPDHQKELQAFLAGRLADIAAQHRADQKTDLQAHITAARTDLSAMIERHMAAVLAKRQEMIGLEEIAPNLRALAEKAADFKIREATAEHGRKLSAVRKEFEALISKPGNPAAPIVPADYTVVDIFRGQWKSDLALKKGQLFTHRGSTYLCLRDARGVLPTKQNQQGANPYYALFSAAGASVRGQDGLSAQSVNITVSSLTMNTARLLGRTTASSGSIEELTVGSNLTLSAGSLTVASSLTSVNSILSAAATNLTLGTGTFGATLTITSATGAATFAGNLTVSGGTATVSGADARFNLTSTGANSHTYATMTGRASSADKVGLIGYNTSSDRFVFVYDTVITSTKGITIDSSGNVSMGGTASGTSTTAAAILGKSMGLTENLFIGGTSSFAGLLSTVASATGGAGLRIPHGAAPTSPVNGDIWTTTAGIFVRINGATVGPLT